METIKEFVKFIDGLKSPIASLERSGDALRTINLKTLTKDIEKYESIEKWILSKNLTDRLKKIIISTILDLNLPENVKNEFISLMI
jgi:hypothetical protein